LGSVRVRTTVAATAVVGVALSVGGVGLVAFLQRSQVHSLDSGAALRAADVAALIQSRTLPARLPIQGQETSLVQVVDDSGRVIASSANIEGEARIAGFRPTSGNPSFHTLNRLPIADSQGFRVAALRVRSPDGLRTVYVAAGLDGVRRTVRTVTSVLLVALPGMLGVVAITTWVIVGRALRPVERIRAEVADLSANALERRVPQPMVDDEIGRLARTMNEMLGRLQLFTERQRQFVADASHELRSPIASLKAQLEVAQADPRGTDWVSLNDEALAEVTRMERLVLDLLTLARADRAAGVSASGVVDLDDVVVTEAAKVRDRGRVRISLALFEPARVRGDQDQLTRLTRNLIENAERHADAMVSVELRADGSTVELVVSDDGGGIPLRERERVFERFTRLDDARDRDAGGSGLGLPIVREIAAAHGGTVVVADSAEGARLVVRLPLS
jgi:signal transduction histidine kinase